VRTTRAESRTDWSNQPFFEKKNQQNGATTQPTSGINRVPIAEEVTFEGRTDGGLHSCSWGDPRAFPDVEDGRRKARLRFIQS
jgi:hypothetical protein